MTYAIETQQLARSFGPVRAVDGIDLRVRSGSIFGFLGPNGAGKTTTLHLLLGLVPPTGGRATVAGLDVATQGDEVRRRCGALLEHNGLYERLSARHNLRFHGHLHGLAGDELDQRIRSTLEAIELWDRRDDAVGTWSRGMKQKLAIGRALLHRPQILFLDEPTAGFDPASAAQLRDDLRRLAREQGLTVFLTTHNLHEAESLCDEVAVLRKGRLAAVGPPDALRGKRDPVVAIRATGITATLLAKLRKAGVAKALEPVDGGLRATLEAGARAAPLVAALVAAGAKVDAVEPVRPSLEADVLAILEEEA